MEVVVPTVNDFHFDSTASSPYVSAPSSPRRFGDPFDYYYHYTSAPTSPSRVAAIVASSSSVPFGWEETPGTPRSPKSDAGCGAADLDDFAFDFSGQMEKGVPPPDWSTADELFEAGKIRPLRPPPRLYSLSLDDQKAAAASAAASAAAAPRSPKSPKRGLWSPRARGGKDVDPFAAAMVEATRERGRDAVPSISSSRSRKGSRSLSPMRSGGAEGFLLPKSSDSPKTSSTAASATTVATECLNTTTSVGGGGGSRKWRLRDLLLFRSASEGRVTGNKSKDPLRKYTIMSQSNSSSSIFSPSPKTKGGEDSRNSSFRSTDSGGSMRKPADSAHGSMRRHYMSNRAVSEEMKKKTALPFNHRQGLFGCLRFNPAVHSLARGFHNSYSFGRRQS